MTGPAILGRQLATIEPEEISWLWRGRLPASKVVLLDGDPGLGKSMLTLDLAARVTTGAPFPDGESCEPGLVVLATAEDGIADTVRPRFDAASGDTSRLYVLDAYASSTGERLPVTLPDHVAALTAHVHELNEAALTHCVGLIIIDPFVAFLSQQVNSRIDHDVRRTLAQLAQLADATGAAVLLVRHLNKAAGGSALYRGGGSIGIVGAARAAHLVARDPEDEARRVFAPVKSNLSALAPSLGFRLVSAPNGAPRVDWLGESTHRADALVTQPADEDERHEAQDLRAFLVELLEVAPRTQREAVAACRAAGFEVSERTVRRARKAAGVQVHRQGFGPGSTVVWSIENGHSGHIPDIGDIPTGVSDMSGIGQYDDPDQVARDAMREDGA